MESKSSDIHSVPIKIGKNVIIEPGVVLGTPGLSFKADKDGVLYPKGEPKFGIIIEDDVYIGANSCVMRGGWRDTVIGKGTKIGASVTVGHNVIVGKHVVLIPGVRLCGSCEIGDFTRIFANAVVHQRVKIGKNVIVGALTFVNDNIPDNSKVLGIPGKIFPR